MSFLPLKDLLPKAVRMAGIANQVEAALALKVCGDVLSRVLPPGVFSHLALLHVVGGTLTIEVANSAIAQEIRLREREILRRLKERCPIMVNNLRSRLRE